MSTTSASADSFSLRFRCPRFNVDPNYYAVLCVSQTASAEEIKASYRKLVLKCHPDKVAGKEVHSSVAIPPSLMASCRWQITNTDTCALGLRFISILVQSEFRLLQRAWNAVSSAEERAIYDSKLRDQAIVASTASSNHLEIDIDDME